MNILLLGSGGREHALAWKLKQSKQCSKLFIAPGNAGTELCGTNVSLDVNDFESQKQFCRENKIELIVVGPEEPLVNGIYNYFEKENAKTSKEYNINLIAPSAEGALLEGSKAFAKKFMQQHNIPTAKYREFNAGNYENGREYISQHALPVVLKANGLAAGKGVFICDTRQEALDVFEKMIVHKQFGEASASVVVEQFLDGIEVSVFVITDGKDYKIIGHAKDYKRIGEGDTGANTGGMGCVSPVPFADEVFMKKVEDTIIKPTIEGLQKERIVYKGFIFFGLIKVDDEPFVIEYNCRLGDPETEVVLPSLKNDLLNIFIALNNNKLNETEIEIDERACATIVAVSEGYPSEYEKGKLITLPANQNADTIVFHAGTKHTEAGIVTNGGRVLAVTAFGNSIKQAVNTSKETLKKISYDGMYYRNDIGYEFPDEK